jgi:hypothetical protein
MVLDFGDTCLGQELDKRHHILAGNSLEGHQRIPWYCSVAEPWNTESFGTIENYPDKAAAADMDRFGVRHTALQIGDAHNMGQGFPGTHEGW